MKSLLVAFAFAGTLIAGAAQAAPVPASGALLADNAPLIELAKKGGHGYGHYKRGNRGLHRGWTRGRGNPHRYR